MSQPALRSPPHASVWPADVLALEQLVEAITDQLYAAADPFALDRLRARQIAASRALEQAKARVLAAEAPAPSAPGASGPAARPPPRR